MHVTYPESVKRSPSDPVRYWIHSCCRNVITCIQSPAFKQDTKLEGFSSNTCSFFYSAI